MKNPVCHTLSAADAGTLLDDIAAVIAMAPLFQPLMPRWGTPFSVLMSNCGPLGWVSDKSGYRYQPNHPVTGTPWPDMPPALHRIWEEWSGYRHPPQACLINYYAHGARMGLHQDRDEEDFDAPVLSISLGDSARFRLGGLKRSDPSEGFDLRSGDVMLLTGPTRLAFHGVDRVFPGTSDLLATHGGLFPQGGRLNLTLRRVTRPLALI